MRPKRCVWCKQEQDACPEGDRADLGRRPWWLWRWKYANVDWDKFHSRCGCFWQMIVDDGKRKNEEREERERSHELG